ncbi:hypothetical protein [Aeromonas veronii]|uniref:hypothetical protein n=1 Tax=Aeromonas veronii TaxID=654 RepID=UPI0032EDCA36
MLRPCFFVGAGSDAVYIRNLETCPDIGPQGETVFTALTQAEYKNAASLNELFGFDAEIFSMFLMYYVLLFVSGYFAGLIARKLGR